MTCEFYNKQARFDEGTNKYYIQIGSSMETCDGRLVLLDESRNSNNMYLILAKKNDREYMLTYKYPFSAF